VHIDAVAAPLGILTGASVCLPAAWDGEAHGERGGSMNWYLAVLQKYADFTGRARRSEYWMFVLFNLIISVALVAVETVVNGTNYVQSLYSLAVLVPSLAVGARRLHDTGRSGWWLLLGLIPCVGAIVLIIFMVQDSTPGPNQFGPNPKETWTPG
jgi:uncharacterized membrane protein YhaH (DUF805 family)